MKIEISNVYLLDYGFVPACESYLIEMDLMDNTIDNVNEWESVFDKISDGRKLKLILEWNENEN